MFVSSGAARGSSVNLLAKQLSLQGRVIWLDAEANLWQLSTRAGVADMVAKCKSANINCLIVDVKPLSGYVLYNSRIAPKMIRVDGRQYPRNYDLLQTVIEEGHKAGIRVHAAINVFSEGSQLLPGGPAFKHPDWQCIRYEVDRFIDPAESAAVPVMCNAGPKGSSICIYAAGSEPDVNLPPGTVYVRVSPSGYAIQSDKAVGRARLAAPKNGFLIIATGEYVRYAEEMVESGQPLQLMGKEVLRRVGEGDNVHHALFVNPLHPEVREYELSIIREICTNYKIDGLVLDRMRYPNIYADFSDITRAEFERYIGAPVGKWPQDVFTRRVLPGDDVQPGPLFKQWLTFRAKVMRDFLSDVRDTVKSTRPNALLGIYVGSWYPLYYDVGVNWGSPANKADYEWWPDGYEQTGYADLLDYMCTGCYYAYPTRKEALAAGEEEWKSVEAAAEESMKAIKDETIVYGSLYVKQYNGRPQKFVEAIRQCLDKTQGCMLFDLVHVREYGWWDVLKQAFPSPKRAPHDDPAMLKLIKEKRASRDK